MVRRDPRSTLQAHAVGSPYAHPFTAPSLTYRALSLPPGAFAASRSPRRKRAQPLEITREQLRVSVWENEGGGTAPLLLAGRLRREG